jgi:hypothetical protein
MEQAASCIKSRMQALSQREHTEVLEYAYDPQEKGADAVMCVKMFEMIAERRRELGKDISASKASAALCEQDANVRDFSKNFPCIFRNALDLEGAPRHLAMLKQLARIRQVVEDREMSEAEANVHATRVILEKTMREPTVKEKEDMQNKKNQGNNAA